MLNFIFKLKISAMTDTSDYVVKMTNLAYSRGSRTIFKDINIVIPKGKITAIMGPSGTGKTTLLRLIGGQIKPDSGTIHLFNQDLGSMPDKALFEARRRLGLLFQSGALFSDLTVFENVAFPLREHCNLPEEIIRDLVLIKLEAVGLRGARNLMPAELSGGMSRRVALARTIALDPELIMFDEPFTGQDPISMGVLVDLVQRLNKAFNMTSIIVSHDIKETLSIADYVYLISEGVVAGEGTPESLIHSEDPWIKQFIQGLPDGPVPFHYAAKDYQEDLLGAN